MRTFLTALAFSAMVSPLAYADTTKTAIGSGVGGALGNIVGQHLGGSTCLLYTSDAADE